MNVNKLNNLGVPFQVTQVTNNKRNACCTKTLKLKGDTVSPEPFYGVSEGYAELKQFNSLEELCSLMIDKEQSGKTDIFFLSGRPIVKPPEGGRYKVRSISRADNDSISLSGKDFICHRTVTLGLIDYDPPKLAENAKYHQNIIDKGLMHALHECMPELGLDKLSYIHRDSTTAGVVITDEQGNSRPHKIMAGIHLPFLLSDGTRLQELLKYMHQACILTGLYWVEPNKLGVGMIKTPVDTAPSKPYTPRIISPVKLINTPGSKLKLSLSENRVIKYVGKSNAMLDVSDMPKHSEEQLKKCEEIERGALSEYNSRPDVAAKIEQSRQVLKGQHGKSSKVSKLVSARVIDTVIENSTIFGDFELYFDGEDKSVSVRTLTGPEGEEYDGTTLHDPLNPSPKNKGKAIFYWNEGKNPYIHSFKHGGYGLKLRAEEQLSSNDWMNRHHAQVLLNGKVLYAVDKRDFGHVDDIDERITFISEADLKKLYQGQVAYDLEGKVISREQ